MRGDEAACRACGEEALQRNDELGFRLYGCLLAWLGVGLLDAGAGRPEPALDGLERAAGGVEARGVYVAGSRPSWSSPRRPRGSIGSGDLTGAWRAAGKRTA